MNSITAPPTDNLYKFIAITGFMFFVAGIVAASYLIEHGMERERRNLEQLAHTMTKKDAVGEQKAFAEFLAKRIDHSVSILQNQLGVLQLGIYAGPIISLIGFGLWWQQTQRYQDRILRGETTIAERRATEVLDEVVADGDSKS